MALREAKAGRLNHEGHEEHEEKSRDFQQLFFVLFVSFVVQSFSRQLLDFSSCSSCPSWFNLLAGDCSIFLRVLRVLRGSIF